LCAAVATIGIAGGGIGGAALVAAPDAQAAAYGVVAVHTGSWGYREVVFGRGTTQQIADSPWWALAGMVVGQAGLYGLPVVESLYLNQYEAEKAASHGICFAVVRPTWIPWAFPGVESWGCR